MGRGLAMDARPIRRFRISDAMILTASVGLGLAMARMYLGTDRGPDLLYDAHQVVNRMLVPLALGLVVVRLLPPRPLRRRLLREPGFLACVGCWVGVLGHLLRWSYPIYLQFKGTALLWGVAEACDDNSLWTGIVAPWLFLGLRGQFRCPKHWVDWSGVIIGSLLIASFVLISVQPYLEN